MLTKTTIVTLSIWAAGISSAAALVHTLTRSPVATEPQHVAAPHEPVSIGEVVPSPNIEKFKVPRPLVVPAHVRSQLRFNRTKRGGRHCSNWKPLASGPITQGVRYCE
jgi:hypothetical protein